MEWVIIGGVALGMALWTYFRMPKVPRVTQKPGEIECPICEDGAPIPVAFGTVCIKGANTTWWGGVETHETDADQIYYSLSMRMQLCHGVLDGILKILINGKEAYRNPIASDQRITMNAFKVLGPGNLVGDVTGSVYCRMGAPNSILGNHTGVYSKPSEINGEAGGLGPGFFGIACVELERTCIGGSPYLAPWAFVVQRIAWRNSAATYGYTAQWYPEKSYIPHGVTGESKWYRFQGNSDTVPNGNLNTWLASNKPDWDDWEDAGAWPMPFGCGSLPPAGLPVVAEGVSGGWDAGTHLWTHTTIYTDPTDFKLLQKIYLYVYCENAAWVWIDDQYVGTTNATNAAVNGSSANFDVTDKLKTSGAHTIIMYCLDEDPAEEPDSTYVYARVVTSPVVDNNVDAATLYSYRDMNPAHIIRECLTDPVWGMGYTDADIDAPSFEAAARTLYTERFGLSLLWSKPGSIEEFISEIERHICGKVYLDRTSGKFKITLIRELSSTEVLSLVSLDESTVERVEDVSRRATGDLVNQVSVSYTSSSMGDEATVTITESGLVQAQGAVIPSKVSYPGITTHDLASRVALRDLKAMCTPSLSCTVIASRKGATLNPGDAFLLTWSEYGLNQAQMRVSSIELGDGRTNRVRIKCVEDVFASPEHNVLAPPADVWSDPTATPVAVPDPIFVDTYNYKSTFMPAKLTDRELFASVDAVFCLMVGASGPGFPNLFNQRFPNNWEEIRAGVWRAREVGQAIPEYYTDGVTVFKGMRLLVAFVEQALYPGAELEAEDKPRQGIYVLTDPGFSWDEETHTYTSTYAQLERAPDFQTGSQLENGCIVYIAGGNNNGGKYGHLVTSSPIVVGTTDLEFERLSSYTAIRGDNLLTEAQTRIYGDGIGDTLNLSATSATPSEWITWPTMTGTPKAQTYPAGRTRWTFSASLDLGDSAETTTITCQLVKYINAGSVTVLAEAESDPIKPGDGFSPHVFWDTYTTHADVNNDQTLGGERLAVRYRLTTTSAEQVVVRFRYGENLYTTRVDTPLVLGETTGGFPHTPYGDVIALDGNGILTIPDMDLCSGEIRVSGSDFKGISIADAKGNGFVGGDKLSIRLTTNCHIHHSETVAAGAAGLNLSTSGGLTGDDADKEQAGPRSQIILQYDDLVGQWEVVGTPTIMDPT